MDDEKLTTKDKVAVGGIVIAVVIERLVQIGLVIFGLILLYRCSGG